MHPPSSLESENYYYNFNIVIIITVGGLDKDDIFNHILKLSAVALLPVLVVVGHWVYGWLDQLEQHLELAHAQLHLHSVNHAAKHQSKLTLHDPLHLFVALHGGELHQSHLAFSSFVGTLAFFTPSFPQGDTP